MFGMDERGLLPVYKAASITNISPKLGKSYDIHQDF
jgi:hypothetical protein